MRRKLAILSIAMLLLVATLFTISASAAPSVNTLDVGAYSKSINAGSTDTYTWVIYNNGTEDCLVQVSYVTDGIDQVDLSIPSDYSAFAPGDDRQIVMTVTPHNNAPSQDVTVTVTIKVTAMNDTSSVTTIQRVAEFHVDSIFGSSGQNKIMGTWDNSLPAPLNGNEGAFLVSIVGWLVVSLSLIYIVEPIIRQLTKKTKTDLDDKLLEAARMPVFLTVMLFGLVTSLQVLYVPTDLMIAIQETYQMGFILLMAWLAYRIFNDVVIYLMSKISSKTDTEIDDVLVPLLHKIGMIVIPLIAVLIIFQGIFKIDITLLVASMGVIGIIIGYAAQQSLSNFFAGIQVLLDRPFKIGDLVELETGEICEVKKIGLRTTHLLNLDENEMIILPNNDVANKRVVNWSRPDNHRCIWAEVGVAYGSDLAKVEKVLLDIVNNHPDVVQAKGQMPFVRLSKFGDSAIVFRVWYWVNEVRKMWRVNHEVKNLIDKRFREEGIEIPFPQSVVTVKNSTETIVAPKPKKE